MEVKHHRVGNLKLEIHSSEAAAGEAAARAAAQVLKELDQTNEEIAVIFATGASQLATLRALTAMPGLPWPKIRGFHLDEYVGIPDTHPASFRRYLREKLVRQVPMREFFEINGSASDLAAFQKTYVQQLTQANPQLCLLGIGENGHLAFNDPPEADFNDPQVMKVVTLDEACRQQQMSEGWFEKFADVPERALTLTIPTLFKVPKLIASVPGPRKARSVRRTVQDPISTACPSTILRNHPDVTIFLDQDSAAELDILVHSH